MRIFRKVTKTKKSLLPTFITPNGLLDNSYARKLSREVKGDNLFSTMARHNKVNNKSAVLVLQLEY
jgi:hypothetical protein